MTKRETVYSLSTAPKGTPLRSKVYEQGPKKMGDEESTANLHPDDRPRVQVPVNERLQI